MGQKNGRPAREALRLTPAVRQAAARLEAAREEKEDNTPIMVRIVSDLEGKRRALEAQLGNGKRALDTARGHASFTQAHEKELGAYVTLAQEAYDELERHLAFATHLAIPVYAQDAMQVIEYARGVTQALEKSIKTAASEAAPIDGVPSD